MRRFQCPQLHRSLCAVTTAAALLTMPAAGRAQVEIRLQNGVEYVSGGVGDDELKALNALRDRFNLKLTLALKSGHYVSDATVRIQDARGQTLVDTVADGPLLYAHLQPGTYTISCTLGGKELRQTAHVPDKGTQHLVFTWAAE